MTVEREVSQLGVERKVEVVPVSQLCVERELIAVSQLAAGRVAVAERESAAGI